MNNEKSRKNLRPFNTLSPEERQKLARLGGLASGEKRRYQAELRRAMIEQLAGIDLARETRKEYRQAILWYVRKHSPPPRESEEGRGRKRSG